MTEEKDLIERKALQQLILEKSRKKKEIQTTLTKEILVRFSLGEIKEILVDLVSTNGVAFQLMNSSAMQRLTSAILRALGAIPIKRLAAIELVHSEAEKIVQKVFK